MAKHQFRYVCLEGYFQRKEKVRIKIHKMMSGTEKVN